MNAAESATPHVASGSVPERSTKTRSLTHAVLGLQDCCQTLAEAHLCLQGCHRTSVQVHLGNVVSQVARNCPTLDLLLQSKKHVEGPWQGPSPAAFLAETVSSWIRQDGLRIARWASRRLHPLPRRTPSTMGTLALAVACSSSDSERHLDSRDLSLQTVAGPVPPVMMPPPDCECSPASELYN